MSFTAIFRPASGGAERIKLFRVMKLLSILLLAACLQVAATGHAQGITLNEKKLSLEKLFREVKKQTGYTFWYEDRLLRNTKPIDITVTDASLETVLTLSMKDQPLTFQIIDKTVVIKEKPVSTSSPENKNLPPAPITVKGRITNEAGEPVQASIVIKGTKNGTTSNAEGYYELNDVPENATLVITGVSIESQEIKVNNRVLINVQVANRVKEEEEVVVAYGRQREQAVTGAVTVVKGTQIATLPNMSFDKSLQGLVPGLVVNSGTGQPGGSTANFILRGVSTGGNTPDLRKPLIVVDGVPVIDDPVRILNLTPGTANINTLAQLNPADIESISVLKDAAAIALYGSKASNGVILVTTKKGKAGKTVFNFRNQTDISTRLNGKSSLLNQEEYLTLLYETYKNTPRSQPWTDASILADLKTKFPVRADGSFYPEENWEDLVYQPSAFTTSNNLSISGGSERTNFYLNFEYTKQDGVVRETGYDRKSVRFNFENRPANWFRLLFNTTLSHNQQDVAANSASSLPIGLATTTTPLIPAYLEDGSYYWRFAAMGNISNPVATNELSVRSNTSYMALSNLTAEFTLFKTVKFSSLLGVHYDFIESRDKWDPRLSDPDVSSSLAGRIEESDSRNLNLITTNSLSYGKQLGRHNLQIMLAQEAQIRNQRFVSVRALGFQTGYIDQLSAGSSVTGTGLSFKQTLASYFGQLNYNYTDRYFLSASIRKDGSSKFGDSQRFGTFWSLGGGWVAFNEKSRSANSWLNFLKLRGSVGAAGNSGAVDRNTRYDMLTMTNYLAAGNTALVPRTSPGNPNIKWEETFNWNIGIEMMLWKNRIGLTADVYKRKTSDLIYTENLALSTGFSSVLENIGDMENRGIEIALSSELIKTSAFTWNLALNWSANANKLLKANVPLAAVGGNLLANEEGRHFNSYYMPQWAGVDPATGSGLWIDTTGKPNSDYNAARKSFVGKPLPDAQGSVINTFSYRGFRLSAMIYYQYGSKVYVNNDLHNDGRIPYNNQDRSALDRWQKPGDIASHPKRTLNNSSGTLVSTRNLYSGNHVRLQNVQLAYQFNQKLVERIGLRAASVFIQGHNLAIWTNFKSDGDLSNMTAGGLAAIYVYPDSKSYSIGVNVSF